MAKAAAPEKKKIKKSADKTAGKKAKSSGSKSKVSSNYLIEIYVPQVVKVEGTVISRDSSGIVLQHKRRASSKLMRTRINMSEIVALPANNGEVGTVLLRTDRRTIVRPQQFKGVAEFAKDGVTIKTVSDGSVFIPENNGYRIEIAAEEE